MNESCPKILYINVNGSGWPKYLLKILLIGWFGVCLLVIVVCHNLKYLQHPLETTEAAFATVEPDNQPPASNFPVPVQITPPSAHLIPGMAVIDISRVLAAHPRTVAEAESYKSKLEAIPSGASKITRASLTDEARREQELSREEIVYDIQQIIAEYATEHHLTFVLDRSANFTNGSRPILYSLSQSNFEDFQRGVEASKFKDITRQILHELAQKRPSNSLPRFIYRSGIKWR